MIMQVGPKKKIVIAGGGTAGWMAATLLARFASGAYSITLVESDAIGAIGVGEATIPQIHHFNNALGLDEAEFVAATKASYKLGIEFDGWLREGERYMHAFGVVGHSVGITPFRQVWLRARAEGQAGELGHYVFNEVVARAGRMGPPSDRSGSIADPVYAYHFDASLYAVYLRRKAEAAGVVRVEGMIERAELDPESGDISALLLDHDRRIEGDLFIDCTGFRALLIGQALGVTVEDWSDLLPCNRAIAVPCARSDAFRPYTQSLARTAGWQWRIPLQHRTGNGHVFCTDYMSEDEATAILLENLDGEPLDEPRAIRFAAGRREQAWARNCVAIGLSAGFMEPLESTSIHLIQSAVARLLKFLPTGGSDEKSRAAFNRMTEQEWVSIRDFLILHYRQNERVGQTFWDRCRSTAIPQSLADRIALYEESGIVISEPGDLFTEEAYTQVLIGQGLKAATCSPLTLGYQRDELAHFLRRLSESYQAKAQSFPTHASYVDAMVSKATRMSKKGVMA